MFFPKRIKGVTAKKHKISLKSDLNNLGSDFFKQKNVQKVGNSLLSTFGFIKYYTEGNIRKVVFKKDGYLLVRSANDLFLITDDSDKFSYEAYLDSDIISHVEYQGQMVLSCTRGTALSIAGYLELISEQFNTSLAKCNDRLFGIREGNKIYMTPAGELSDFDHCCLTAHTTLDALVTLDKLYALGDTCYSLTSRAEELDMKFVPFCYGIGSVQIDSVATFGKRAIFATENGLYELKSNSITQVFTALSDYVSFIGCAACSYKGKYYIACKKKNGDMLTNDVLLVLDVDSEKISGVLDLAVESMCVGEDGKLYIVSNGFVYVSSDVTMPSSYVETVDFGCSDVKYLDKLTVRSQYEVEVWIDNGSEKRRYCVPGKNMLQRLPLAGSGRQFTVELQAQNGLQLDYVELSARTYEV